MRRARYLSEAGRKVLPAARRKLRNALLDLQNVLGEMHDATVQLALLEGLSPATARRARARLTRRRAAALKRFRARWRQASRQM